MYLWERVKSLDCRESGREFVHISFFSLICWFLACFCWATTVICITTSSKLDVIQYFPSLKPMALYCCCCDCVCVLYFSFLISIKNIANKLAKKKRTQQNKYDFVWQFLKKTTQIALLVAFKSSR